MPSSYAVNSRSMLSVWSLSSFKASLQHRAPYSTLVPRMRRASTSIWARQDKGAKLTAASAGHSEGGAKRTTRKHRKTSRLRVRLAFQLPPEVRQQLLIPTLLVVSKPFARIHDIIPRSTGRSVTCRLRELHTNLEAAVKFTPVYPQQHGSATVRWLERR